MANQIKFVSTDTAKVYASSDSNSVLLDLLWGDQVTLVSNTITNGRYKVNARWAQNAFIETTSLQDTSLLELYFIDVGQGDGILIVTPDRRYIMIDGGYTREKQPHGKSAADFVDWKFFVENNSDTISLDAMIISHCDADHYGGSWDLLNTEVPTELDTKFTTVKEFYHAGVSWWTDNAHNRFLGHEENGALIDLLTGITSLRNGLKDTADLKLQGEWAQFLKCVVASGAGVNRISYNPEKGFDYLQGYEEDKDVSIKILGPIEHTINGKPTLKDLGGDSQNTNGNSILLRVDYGKSRILLTGDLNLKSQQYIMESFAGNKQELAADVVKACHHGSDDCSIEFLQYVQAAATIISSGDDETHAHPRPNIIAASGITGFRKVASDKLITPLVYSTEISRSYKLGDPFEINVENHPTPSGEVDLKLEDEKTIMVSYKQISSGALSPSYKEKPLKDLKVIDGIVYGLVNVRTDGHKILCATLNEGKRKWEIKTFFSRF